MKENKIEILEINDITALQQTSKLESVHCIIKNVRL